MAKSANRCGDSLSPEISFSPWLRASRRRDMCEPELPAGRDCVHEGHEGAPARIHREARQPFMQAEHRAIELGRGLAALQPAKLAALRLRRAVGVAHGEIREQVR